MTIPSSKSTAPRKRYTLEELLVGSDEMAKLTKTEEAKGFESRPPVGSEISPEKR